MPDGGEFRILEAPSLPQECTEMAQHLTVKMLVMDGFVVGRQKNSLISLGGWVGARTSIHFSSLGYLWLLHFQLSLILNWQTNIIYLAKFAHNWVGYILGIQRVATNIHWDWNSLIYIYCYRMHWATNSLGFHCCQELRYWWTTQYAGRQSFEPHNCSGKRTRTRKDNCHRGQSPRFFYLISLCRSGYSRWPEPWPMTVQCSWSSIFLEGKVLTYSCQLPY